MLQVIENIEELLEVGRAAVVHMGPKKMEAARHRTTIRGWLAGKYVIFDVPMIKGQRLMMRRHQDCVVRFVYKGKACGFEGTVFDIGSAKNLQFQITWPSFIEVLTVRKHERVETLLPCVALAANGDRVEGDISDLSLSGCAISMKHLPKEGDLLHLAFRLPSGAELPDVPCKVKNIRQGRGGFVVGCAFHTCPREVMDDIQFYVSGVLDERRGVDSTSDTLLIFDQGAAAATAVKKVLEKNGYDVIIASGAVEAFFRLRSTPPRAVLVHYARTDLNALDVARVIKETPGCEDLPVFIYGGKDEDYEEAARNAGAAGYFKEGFEVSDIIDAVELHTGVARPAKDD